MFAKILIVEDEILVAMQLEDVLIHAGYDVIGIVPDLPALGRVKDVPQVALVDINLRDGRSGPSIAHQLSDRFGTSIVYVTANPEQIGVPAATAVGVVAKPFSARSIVDAVNYALLGGGQGTKSVACPADLEPIFLQLRAG